jgi:hypothetical protein
MSFMFNVQHLPYFIHNLHHCVICAQEMRTIFWLENLMRRDCLGGVFINVRVILKFILDK